MYMNQDFAKHTGERIKFIRVSKKVSRNAIAKAIGVNPSTVTRYENGNITIPLEMALKIAQVLGVNVYDFVQGFKY